MTTAASSDPRTLGQVFADAKDDRDAKYSQVRDYLLLEHGLTVTNQTVANYHQDSKGATNPETIAGIAAFYGLTLDDLPADARERCLKASRVLVLIGGGRTDPKAPGGDQTGEKWAAGESNPEPAESLPEAA